MESPDAWWCRWKKTSRHFSFNISYLYYRITIDMSRKFSVVLDKKEPCKTRIFVTNLTKGRKTGKINGVFFLNPDRNGVPRPSSKRPKLIHRGLRRLKGIPKQQRPGHKTEIEPTKNQFREQPLLSKCLEAAGEMPASIVAEIPEHTLR